MLSSEEFDAYFDNAKSEWFRLEGLSSYKVDVEQPRLRAYLAGEPYASHAAPSPWYEEIERRVREGIAFRKVRVLAGPLSEYERWECEWSYTATERLGQRTFIIDRSEVDTLPELPPFDWWMMDGRVVLRMHYDNQGRFLGASAIDDPEEVAAYVRLRDQALDLATPFPAYWRSHPQYWRENWLRSGS
ncbi:DUF6879 family protein [Streptomyces sp. NPDC059853]|uniref:DUF6879 family protein n=1 Tax=Streptomyces sp. NPDC059853 TaxID=3346973 RepID=UPI0036533FD2